MASPNDNHLGLLCNVGELAARLAGSADVRAFLDQIVEMVARHLRSDVCSIYLYEEAAGELVLRATRGLAADSVGRVRLRLGEGLVGLALKELRPICEACASRNPNFRRFEGINEESYESFLAVPVLKGIEKIGVLVVQRLEEDPFDESDVMALRATAGQLATVIENARVVLELRQPGAGAAPVALPPVPKLVRGQVASGGLAHGPATILDVSRARRMLAEGGADETSGPGDFPAALSGTVDQLQELHRRLEQRLPEMASLIFDAHLMMLKDPAFSGEIAARIEQGATPARAVVEVGRKYMDLFAASSHAYLREKAHDVEDLVLRLLANLHGADDDAAAARERHVVIARELYPSDMLKLASADIAGVVLVSGGLTSHVSILARSLRIPLVIAQEPRLLDIPAETNVLVDAETGTVYVDPPEDVRAAFTAREAARAEARAAGPPAPETATRDGQRIRLLANVNLLSDAALAREMNAEGVGLYRSEFPFLIRAALPTEEEQYVIYRRLIAGWPGRVVTFRTLDVGGDKLLAYYDEGGEENPALGLRSLRFTFRHADVFAQQLRAILRAAAGHEALRIMFPMISSVEDLQAARGALDDCRRQLHQQGLPHNTSPSVGIMVEVPSAVEIIDDLARRADFLCVGTNDLTQFLLAVDRTNEKVARYFTPHHPAVLRALRRIADAGRRHGKEVSVCGEMAHVPQYASFLVGIGIRTLSANPQYLPAVQAHLAGLTAADATRRADAALAESTLAGTAAQLGLDDGTR